MIKDLFDGIFNYFRVFLTATRYCLWKYLFLSGLLSMIIGTFLLYGAYLVGGNLGEGLFNWMAERYSEFFVYFHGPFSEYKITLGLRFLDYHYQKYIDKYGNGLDFLMFIQDNLHELTTENEARKEIFERWIENKMKEFSPPALLDKEIDELRKLKSIKINEMNKPKLTQVQISILFRLMKDDKIISNRDISNTAYSILLHYLTGYSNNTLRINFSCNQLIEISDHHEDYEQIIESLNSLIQKLNKEKNQISPSR